MSNVILVGAFGQANPGDEALCQAFCHALSHHDVTIASSDPDGTEHSHGRRSVSSSARPVASAVRRADAVIVGGGTVFKRLHGSSGRHESSLLRNTAALIAGSHAQRTPVAMIGVGAGDLRSRGARSLCRWMVPRADLVVLRDEESASVLTDAGVEPPFRIGSDPTWVLFDAPQDDSRRPRDGRSITVALSHLAADREATDTLTEVLRPMVDEWSIRLQPWQHGANDLDRRLADELRQRLGRVEIIDPPADLHAAAATFASDDLVIGMRFHALVAAAAAGSRFVAISHEPKLAGLARRMSQAAVPGHATADVMRGTIEWALANEPPSAAAVRNEIANASHAFDLLELLLDGDSFARPDELAALPLSSGTGTW